MSTEIRMPALSPTMEKGTLAKWLVKEGDTIAAGDIIAEIETDKATMEVEAVDEGVVVKLEVKEGTADIPVGAVIARLSAEGEAAARPAKKEAAKPEAPKAAPKPEPKAEAKPAAQKPEAAAPDARPTASATPPQAKAAAGEGERAPASPLARRLASQSGIDIATIKGSGPGGRVIKRDLESAGAPLVKPAAAAAPAAPAPKAAPAAAAVIEPVDAPYEEIKLSMMRKVIAQRLTESKTTVPHFYISVDVEMDRLLEVRKDINESEGLKLSVNDFIIKALAMALRRVPEANVQFAGDKLYKYNRADVSVAVAIDGGLITPIIRGADSKGLVQINEEMRGLAERARQGKLMPEEYKGGTVSLSNLGMYGIKQFEAVINPPQAAILAVGAAEQRAVVKNGQLTVATVMSATLSCDHRAIDGAVGAKLLTTFKAMVENPARMVM